MTYIPIIGMIFVIRDIIREEFDDIMAILGVGAYHGILMGFLMSKFIYYV